MKTTADETTDVRAFWAWCGGQGPLVLHIQLDVGSSSKNGVCPKAESRYWACPGGAGQSINNKKVKSKAPPPKSSGVGCTGSSWVGGELGLWPFCFFTLCSLCSLYFLSSEGFVCLILFSP